MPLVRPMTGEVLETRVLLDQVMAVELPELEGAIRDGDYDLAFSRAAIVRDVRNRVRALLGGAEGAGQLRSEWALVEPRIDTALVAAPRPNLDPELGRQSWQSRRSAQGTGSHGRRTRLTTQGTQRRRRASTTERIFPAQQTLAPSPDPATRRAARPTTPMRTPPPLVTDVHYSTDQDQDIDDEGGGGGDGDDKRR